MKLSEIAQISKEEGDFAQSETAVHSHHRLGHFLSLRGELDHAQLAVIWRNSHSRSERLGEGLNRDEFRVIDKPADFDVTTLDANRIIHLLTKNRATSDVDQILESSKSRAEAWDRLAARMTGVTPRSAMKRVPAPRRPDSPARRGAWAILVSSPETHIFGPFETRDQAAAAGANLEGRIFLMSEYPTT
ncbi:hypothetical protein [Kineosporia sp. NBRC 101677]|uniref:hypothetical protein n=1 Tax=Kineosporia sp. NBRC 101677 TaxID=3032197 RepID=UPI002553E2F4|nr:hypothetical protein [Kineosporia sp. NBRC 101677]